MLHWTPEGRASRKPPREIKALIKALQRRLGAFGNHGYPRLERVSWREHELDWNDLEAAVEVAPGLLLPADFDDEPNQTPLLEACVILLDDVIEGVEVAVEHASLLAGKLDAVREESRRLLAPLQAEGLPTRLLRVTLQPYDHWRGSLEPGFEVEIESLDDRLVPVAQELRIADVAELATEVDVIAEVLRRRVAARAQLAAAGTDGMIDELALAAIKAQCDPAIVMRQLGSVDRLWLDDGTCIYWNEGHVQTGDGSARTDGFAWTGDRFTSSRMFVDREIAMRAVGKPVTALMTHAYLNDDMIVRAVETEVDEGTLYTTAKLDMPRHRFCTSSGRVW